MQDFEKIIESISNVCVSSFWMSMQENTKDFPDTADAVLIREFIIESSLAVIFSHWILGYPVSERKEITLDFIKGIKNLEFKLRDHVLDVPEDD